jgi:hypothetical protein
MDERPTLWHLFRLCLEYVDFVWATIYIRAGLRTIEKIAPKHFWKQAWVLHHERREYIFDLLYHLSLVDEEPVKDLATMFASRSRPSF